MKNKIMTTPLRIIDHPQGDIYHAMKNIDAGYIKFGEAYFSTIKPNLVKGWKMHKKMTLNIIVPLGIVKFVIIKDIKKQINKKNIFEVELSRSNYQRLTIPPKYWVAFQCTSSIDSLILNIADIKHDPDEIERLDIDKIDYNWKIN